MKNICEASV